MPRQHSSRGPAIVGAGLAAWFLCAAASASAQAPPAVSTATSLAGTVTLSLAEYNALLELAARRPAPPAMPVAGLIARADAAVRVDGDLGRATITLQGDVLRSGPTGIPLMTGGTVIDARLAGQTVPLTLDKGVVVAVLPGGGPFTLTVTWAGPVASEPGRASLALPVIAAGTVRAAIDVAGEATDARVEPGLVTRRTSATGRTTIDATLTPGAAARVVWSSREAASAAAPRELRMLSDVKSMVTIGEADVRVAALFDVSVVQGSASGFAIRVPEGFEVTGLSGATVEVAREEPGLVRLNVLDGARRRHQFLVSLERAAETGATQDVPLPWLDGAQRETGEMAAEGAGALDLQIEERPSLTRIDVGEVSAPLQGLARGPLLAAGRYQRRTGAPVVVAFAATRHPDAAVLTAVVERAAATTLVTAGGRALTEVAMTVRNQAQPFLKVGLPQGATLLSAEIDGIAVKPARGGDGIRVPLLRAGLATREPYRVSFVYVHEGTPFARKGQARLSLARVDVPVTWLEWELFLPDRFAVSRFEGEAFPARLVSAASSDSQAAAETTGMMERVSVVAAEPRGEPKAAEAAPPQPPSINVQNLQRRAAGVLPIRIDLPRAGHSHTFVRPLVLDEATTIGFRYKSK